MHHLPPPHNKTASVTKCFLKHITRSSLVPVWGYLHQIHTVSVWLFESPLPLMGVPYRSWTTAAFYGGNWHRGSLDHWFSTTELQASDQYLPFHQLDEILSAHRCFINIQGLMALFFLISEWLEPRLQGFKPPEGDVLRLLLLISYENLQIYSLHENLT